jgi:DNA topoisomerase-6 subunit B
MPPKKAKTSGDVLQQKSPAEFFAENKNIAGFDNVRPRCRPRPPPRRRSLSSSCSLSSHQSQPGKCLYTTIRELVENALDAAESIGALPDIEVTVEEVSLARLNAVRGVGDHARLDEALYQDWESAADRARRAAKEAKEAERLEKALAKSGADAGAADARRRELGAKQKAAAPRAAEKSFFRVTVRDNGAGMAHADIPEMLGRVLSGTKYGVKQTRGKFGLGAKMALIWSKMSTGLPIEVTSALPGAATVSYYKLDIDIRANRPNVHEARQTPNSKNWHGAELSLTIAGNWSFYRAKVLKYLQQIAVITPYTRFRFRYAAEEARSSFEALFARRTEAMPPPPTATKHHPSSVDLELIKRLAAATPAPTLTAFLCREFACVSRELAGRIVGEMRAGADAATAPSELDARQAARLHQLLHEVRFPDPDGAHLSPAGEYNLRLGVMKELRPELVATHAGPVGAHEGHAFVVEAAVSVGGRDIRPGINVYRFANRIPLLFEGGSDVITRTALKRVNWASYKINAATDRVAVFVSVVSTKIPFKGAGKEYMADDVEEIQAAVKAAVQACGVQLKAKIARAQAAREQRQRKRSLTRYIPDVAAAVMTVVKAMAAAPDAPHAEKRRRLDALPGRGVVAAALRGEVTEALLAQRLAAHVERVDSDAALEYQVAQGLAGGARTEAHLAPAGARHAHGPELHAECAVLRLLSA